MFMSKTVAILPVVVGIFLTGGILAHGQEQTTGTQEQTTASRVSVDATATEAAVRQAAENPDALSWRKEDGGSTPTLLNLPNAPASAFYSSGTVVLASWKGGQLTNDEVSRTLQLRKPRSMGDMVPEQFRGIPAPRQREIIKDLAYELILYQKAKQEGLDENMPEVAQRIREFRNTALARLYFQREVEPKLRRLDEQAAREYYEENKNELFTRPAYTLLQNLHLSKLKPYTAGENDTLEGLAEQQTGSADNTHRIHRGIPPYFRRAPAPEHKQDVPTAALTKGEKLLLPLTDDEMTSKRGLANELRQRLLDGAEFQELAREYSETGGVDPLTSFTLDSPGLHPQYAQAVDSAETSFTEWVETPFGLDLLYIADRATTMVIPFEDVKESLVTQASTDPDMAKRTVEQARKDAINALRQKYNLRLNQDLLASKTPPSPDAAAGETTIAVTDKMTYTLEEFQRDLQMMGKPWQSVSPEERTEVVLNAPRVMSHLILRAAEDLQLDKTDSFREQMESKTIMEVTSEYLKQKMQQVMSPTEQELRRFYEQNIERYTSPSQVTLREISKRINMSLPPERRVAEIEAAKKELGELRNRLKTVQDFEQAARRQSEAISTRSRGGLIGRVSENFRGETFRGQIEDLKPGEVSEPFLYGTEVMIVRLDERTPPVVQPFEQVLRRLRQDYLREVPEKKLNAARQQALEEAGFELKF